MRRIVAPIFSKFNHKSFKFSADDAYVVFDHADSAIQAALAIHSAIQNSKLKLTDSELFRVCIGIGYGEMLYSETLEGECSITH